MDYFKHNPALKWAVGAIVTVILGALGSGLWELLVKPLGPKAMEFAIYVLTLGLSAQTDQMYVEVAKATPERVAISVYTIIFPFYLIFIISGPVFAKMRIIQSKKASRAFLHNSKARLATIRARIAKQGNYSEQSTNQIENELDSLESEIDADRAPLRFVDATINLMIVALIPMTIYLVLNSARTIYIVRAQAHLSQLQAILFPYENEDYFKKIKSRVALINSKNDYTSIADELSNKIKSQNIEPPIFKAF